MNTAAAATATGTTAAADKRKQEKPYRGIRMRKWGKWVAEIREPNKRSRIWLGSYSTPVAAAMAYDTAVFYLRGPTAPLNFPDHLPEVAAATDVLSVTSPAAIRKKAAEVGARVDAIQTSSTARINKHHAVVQLQHKRKKPDLNEIPDPDENSDEDD